ncbi:hypothetical protein V6N12_045217 [Hibiscus sabdariffa]|uniref:Ycf2 N-terminal domain-containing protein n=1 Tax=Hibiscus sabdariffa TaxID=183260 RepID=A0ABR2G235_9ROSI
MLWGGGPTYGVKSIRSKKKYLNINLIDIIDLISIIPKTRGPSTSTWHCSVRLSPIAENSPLLPPVGVWAVSQSQCG